MCILLSLLGLVQIQTSCRICPSSVQKAFQYAHKRIFKPICFMKVVCTFKVSVFYVPSTKLHVSVAALKFPGVQVVCFRDQSCKRIFIRTYSRTLFLGSLSSCCKTFLEVLDNCFFVVFRTFAKSNFEQYVVSRTFIILLGSCEICITFMCQLYFRW